MENNTKEIDKIIFGIFSPEEIIKMAGKIDSSKLVGPGSVYDERMGGGGLDNSDICVTCELSSKKCPGHFGYIELNEYVIHPLYFKSVLSFLKCFCINCHKLLLLKEQLSLYGFFKLKKEKRFFKILERIEKVDICCHCSSPQPKIAYTTTDNTISIIYKEKIKNNGMKKDQKISIILSADDIKKKFDAISDSDVKLCGFNPDNVHPKNLILSVLLVLPPCARPFVIADGNICDDDLTNQTLEIIKANNQIKQDDTEIPTAKSMSKRQKAIQSLKFRIATLFDNSQGKAKHPTNGRPIKGIKERISGKEGQIRSNHMGKRVEFSGRTVIGPDPNLNFGEIGMPPKIAKDLTIPERVTPFNIKYLSELVNNKGANFIIRDNEEKTKINLKYASVKKGTPLLFGDVIIRKGKRIIVANRNMTLQKGDKLERNGKNIDNVKIETSKKVNVKIGDEVYRHLKDNDIVLLNRQPTLHKGSMLAKRVKIIEGKTFRMNLATTKTYNADFDGDEMNIHVPQSLETRTELELLSATKHNIISAQASKPIIAIVQDSLVSAYLMTKETTRMSKSQFFNISMNGKINGGFLYNHVKIKNIEKVLKMKGKDPFLYTGHNLISLLLPDDFIYEKKNGVNPKEPIVKIYMGVFYEGTLDKSILGSSHNSLIQIILKDYGVETASEFISNIQFITNEWLLMNGFSVGLEDCLVTSEQSLVDINDQIRKCYIEAKGIEETTHNPGIREVRITAALSKAKDVGMKISKESMAAGNNLLSTVKSGSKGDFFNIAQLTGLLGQQNLLGKRVPPLLNNGKRTLPHYNFGKLSKELEYESRGFIKNSFIGGLNPQEFYFHAMSGREGICDTAMGTAKSGYIQRRIVKMCEDIQVQYDGSVRDISGSVYQLSYGYNSMDPTKTIKVGKKQQPCNISRIIDRLNLQHEMNEHESEEHKKKSLIKQISKITKRKKIYEDWDIPELEQRLESLKV